jgi:uncharacterized membrane protein HdeD (DUF308 family)
MPSGTEPQDDSTTELLDSLANMGWQTLLTMGLASIALGVVALSWPGETLCVVGVLFGVYLLVIGVFRLGRVSSRDQSVGFALAVGSGPVVLLA